MPTRGTTPEAREVRSAVEMRLGSGACGALGAIAFTAGGAFGARNGGLV